VKAKNSCGTSGYSNSDTGYAGSAPAAPTGVVATDGTVCGAVRVTWDAVGGATGYEVYRDGTKVGETAGTSYDDVPGDSAIHTYKVKAKNSSCTSGDSNADNGHAGSAPTAPTGAVATDGTVCGAVRVTWDAVSGATGYEVYRDGTKVGETAGTSYDDVPGDSAIHTYKVKAKNSCGTSGYSNSDAGYAGSAPAAPTGVAATDGTVCAAVRVTWNAVAGATGYEVYRDGTKVGETAGTSYNDVPGDSAIHTYKVKAKNSCGTSGYSNSDAGFAGSAPPLKFTRWQLNPNGTVTVEWTGGGVLQAAPTVLGPWFDTLSASSPSTIAPTGRIMFLRIRK
jgi:hypothetical protein